MNTKPTTCNPEECARCKAVARDLPTEQLFEFYWQCQRTKAELG